MTIRRRLANAGLVAVLATGSALAVSAPAAAASTPHYVAVVISGHGAHCVRWKSGITGDTVLNDVATVGYRSDGLIVQIDGDPASGTADATHFWSYWHDTSGAWSYSSKGASGYAPKAGSVEGWAYDNGKSNPPKPTPDPAGLYAKLCGAKDRAVSAPIVRASTSSSAPTRSAGAPKRHERPSRAETSSATASRRPSSTGPTPSRSASRHPSSSAGSHRRSSAASTPSGRPTDSSSNATGSAGSRPSSSATLVGAAGSGSSSGTPTGLFVGLGLVVLLAAGAGLVALRRRNA